MCWSHSNIINCPVNILNLQKCPFSKHIRKENQVSKICDKFLSQQQLILLFSPTNAQFSITSVPLNRLPRSTPKCICKRIAEIIIEETLAASKTKTRKTWNSRCISTVNTQLLMIIKIQRFNTASCVFYKLLSWPKIASISWQWKHQHFCSVTTA